jgi:prepilin peptidase dependent protein B
MMINRKFSNRNQRGFTLVELMVGLVVGLIVIGGSLAIFLSSLSNSNYTLKMAKLNQDLTSVMQLMVNEVRRAGYTSDISITPTPAMDYAADSANSCFLYSHGDKDGNVVKRGFNLTGSVLMMREDPTLCNFTGGDAVTDVNSMTVTNFGIDDSRSKCVYVSDSSENTCTTAVASGLAYIKIREIEISLSAKSATDDTIFSTMTESVRVRNDLFAP